MDKEVENMMEAASEIEAEKRGKGAVVVGVHLSGVKKPEPKRRSRQPDEGMAAAGRIGKQLSASEATEWMNDAARSVDEEDRSQSRQGDTPDERFARLHRTMDKAERTLEEVRDEKRRQHMRNASIEEIDRELEGMGF